MTQKDQELTANQVDAEPQLYDDRDPTLKVDTIPPPPPDDDAPPPRDCDDDRVL
jgi:hypothetical protein